MSSPQSKTPLCEFVDCSADAVAEVHAQWAMFDFVYYVACLDHVATILEDLRLRLVDGQGPVDTWLVYWLPE